MGRSWKVAAVVALGAVLFAACGREGVSDENGAVESVIRSSVAAENAKDAKTFAAYWTDKGLKSYDVGTRADLLAGKNADFGSDPITIYRFSGTAVTGDSATTTLDATSRDFKVANAIFRVEFDLIRSEGKWLLDGFKFVGSAPPAEGVKVLNVNAKEYAFDLDSTEVPGDFAMKFANIGKEQHELTFFKGPDGVDVGTAKTALQNLDGQKLEPLPAGYAVDHLSFAEPGMSSDISFATPLAPGTYIFACYIPEGGFGERGPVNPNGKPHIQLGMINVLTVK
jgi:hypothetical protein